MGVFSFLFTRVDSCNSIDYVDFFGVGQTVGFLYRGMTEFLWGCFLPIPVGVPLEAAVLPSKTHHSS